MPPKAALQSPPSQHAAHPLVTDGCVAAAATSAGGAAAALPFVLLVFGPSAVVAEASVELAALEVEVEVFAAAAAAAGCCVACSPAFAAKGVVTIF